MSYDTGLEYRICRGCLGDSENGMVKIQTLNSSSEMHSLLQFLGFEALEIESSFICEDCILMCRKVLAFKSQCESSRMVLQAQSNKFTQSNNPDLLLETKDTKNSNFNLFSFNSDLKPRLSDIPSAPSSNPQRDGFECIEIKQDDDMDIKQEVVEEDETRDNDDGSDRDYDDDDDTNTEPDKKPDISDQSFSNAVHYKCSFCKKSFQQEHYFLRHKYFSHGETNNLFPCMVKYCHRMCNSEVDLKNHHAEMHVTKCNLCDKEYKSNLYLRKHRAKYHFSPKFCCSECPKEFKKQELLNNHIDKHHSTDNKKKHKVCEICGRGCANLRRHMLAIHLNIKNYKCDYCDAKFLDKYKKVTHEKIRHFNYKRFKCEYCVKSFAYKPELVNHIRVHTGEKPFVCSICARAFAQERTLQLHLKIIHKIVKEKKKPPTIDDNQVVQE